MQISSHAQIDKNPKYISIFQTDNATVVFYPLLLLVTSTVLVVLSTNGEKTKIKTKKKKKGVSKLLLPPGLANHEVCTAHAQYPDT